MADEPEKPEGQGRIDVLKKYMQDRFVPDVVAPTAEGLYRINQTIAYPFAWVLGLEDREAREEKAAMAASLPHSMAAHLATTGGNALETAGGLLDDFANMGREEQLESMGYPPRRRDERPPGLLEPATEATQAFYREQAQTAEELRPEDPSLSSLVMEGAGMMVPLIAEVVGTSVVTGPAVALPLLIANQHSRDPSTGEYQGALETAKGAGMGYLMHGIGKVASQMPTRAQQVGVGAGGFAMLTAGQGGTQKDVMASAFLGGGLSSMSPKPTRNLALEQEAKAMRPLDRMVDEMEYGRPLAENAPRGQGELDARAFLGLDKGEAEVARPQNMPENGVPRTGHDPAPEGFPTREEAMPRAFHVDGEALPRAFNLDGSPATARPGQPVTPWQIMNLREAAENGIEPSVWTKRFNARPKFGNDTPELEHAMAVLEQYGGAQAFFGAHGGRQPIQDTINRGSAHLSRMLGESPEQVVARTDRGLGRTPEEVAAGLMVMHTRSAELHAAMAGRRNNDPGSHVNLMEAQTRYVASLYDITGAGSMAGRTLNMFKGANTARLRAAAAREMVERYGGKNEIEDFHDALSYLQDPAIMASMMKQSTNAASRGWGWKAADAWTAGLLTGFNTHMTNLGSTGIFIGGFYGIEQPMAAAAGLAKLPFQKAVGATADALAPGGAKNLESWIQSDKRWKVPGTDTVRPIRALSIDTSNRVTAPQVVGQLWGMTQSTKFALESFGRSWVTGEEFSVQGVKGGTPFGIKDNPFAEQYKHAYAPFRLLTAEDAGMKAFAFSAHLYGKGVREASLKNIPLRERPQYIRQFVSDVLEPPEGVSHARQNVLRQHAKEGMERAATLSFTNELGALGQSIAGASNASPIAKPVVTFVRTPLNVNKQSIYRTPYIGWVAPKNMADVLAGGARQNEAMARMAIGSLIAIAIHDEVLSGNITGTGSQDPAERERERSMGKAPASFKATDSRGEPIMKSYAKYEPYATGATVMATLVRARQAGLIADDDLAGAMEVVAASFGEVLVGRSMMEGTKRAIDAAEDPDKNLAPYLAAQVGSIVPAISNQYALANDAFKRDQTGLPEAVLGRIFGARDFPEDDRGALLNMFGFDKPLPKMHDLVGRPMQSGDLGHEPFARMLDTYSTPLTPHPILDLMSLVKSGVTRTGKSITITKRDLADKNNPQLLRDGLALGETWRIEMTPEEREEINHYSNLDASNFLIKIDAAGILRDEDGNIKNDVKVKKDLAELEALGAFPAIISQMRADRVARGAIAEASLFDYTRSLVSHVYSRYRNQYRDEMVRSWREKGTLREELDRAQNLYDTSIDFRKSQQGGFTTRRDSDDSYYQTPGVRGIGLPGAGRREEELQVASPEPEPMETQTQRGAPMLMAPVDTPSRTFRDAMTDMGVVVADTDGFVDVDNVDPRMEPGLKEGVGFLRTAKIEAELTSGRRRDGEWSLHENGNAFDVRLKHATPPQIRKLREELTAATGRPGAPIMIKKKPGLSWTKGDFEYIIHGKGDNIHLHIERDTPETKDDLRSHLNKVGKPDHLFNSGRG